MTLALRYAARSHVGLVRTGNEDSGYAGPTMLVVADGMGGHAAGELASAAAVATFAGIDADADEDDDDVLPHLAAGVQTTTDTIRSVVSDRPQLSGMGTTLTAIAWRQGLVNLAHVGDSRAYLLRDGALSQMTHDHTYVQMLVDTGRITEDEAFTHPRRNLILRAIDGTADVEPDLQVREARVGDRYLLCSDGLCGVVPEPELTALLAEGDPTYAVTALVEAALEHGAPDNVTVVVADVIDVSDEAEGAVPHSDPVVVGAAGEPRNRERLSTLEFPADVEPVLRPEDAASPRNPVELDGVPEATSGRRRWILPLVAAVLVVAVAVVGVLALVDWARSRYFVGSDSGTVAIFQGLPQSVAGYSLFEVTERTSLAVAALPDVDQSAVLGTIAATDLDDARRIVSRLEAEAARCALSATQGCPQPPAPTPLPVTTAQPSLSPSKPALPSTSPTALVSPAPSVSAT